ncbi:MAG: glycosyltransferase [bacterium]
MNTPIRFELYQRNLGLLLRIYPQYQSLFENGIPDSTRFDIQPLGSQSYTCSMKTAPCPADGQGQSEIRWIHGPGDPWAWAEERIREAGLDTHRTFVTVRPGLGYLPFLLYPRLRKGRHAQRLLLAEDRIDLFRLALQLFDWTDLLRSDRVILLLTDNPVAAVVQFFSINPVAILPPLRVQTGIVEGGEEHTLMAALRQQLTELARTVNGAARQYLQELRDHYRTASPAKSRSRRVLLVEPEHEYLARPLAGAFEQEGCQVSLFQGNPRMIHFLNPYIWLAYTREHFPDILFWMNRNTLSPEGAEALATLPIQKILWFLDSPKRVQTSREELQATDVCFSFDPTYVPYLRVLGGGMVQPLATAAGILPLPECVPGNTWPTREGAPIGFVGALAADRFQEVREFWYRRDPDFVRILDDLVDEYMGDPAISLEERYERSPGRERLPYQGFVVLYLEERATWLRRLRFLLAVHDLGLTTYGAPEWGNPDWARGLVPCFSGVAPQYTELSRVYYHTRINVNVFHVQCVDSCNPRVYDVLAAGGFLLTEYRPALEREFRSGEHLVCFHTPEELREKAEYYTAHPDERDAIARAGQAFVLNHATYRHRVRDILSAIG